MRNRKKYSDLWHDVIRPAILKRDGYKCQEPGCNVRHKSVGYYTHDFKWIECDTFMSVWATKQGFNVQKISLQVAHLDQDPSNNDESNLKSLCPRHHFIKDLPFNLIKRKIRRNPPAA